MKETEIRTMLRDYIIGTWLSGDGRGFDDETDLTQAGVLDSFSTLDMASFIDERFRVRLEPSDINAGSFRNVSSLTSIVLAKIENATPAAAGAEGLALR